MLGKVCVVLLRAFLWLLFAACLGQYLNGSVHATVNEFFGGSVEVVGRRDEEREGKRERRSGAPSPDTHPHWTLVQHNTTRANTLTGVQSILGLRKDGVREIRARYRRVFVLVSCHVALLGKNGWSGWLCCCVVRVVCCSACVVTFARLWLSLHWHIQLPEFRP